MVSKSMSSSICLLYFAPKSILCIVPDESEPGNSISIFFTISSVISLVAGPA